MPLRALRHPAVRAWFEAEFTAPTPCQAKAWPEVRGGGHTLIAAPTGSGKTLAAFLAVIDELAEEAGQGLLDDAVRVVYVSPLKALSYDIERNLEAPLRGVAEWAGRLGLPPVAIRAMARTGDTPAAARQAMARKPPHILVTTPESLHILLTSESGRKALARTRTVIVDEIHAVAGDKRGAHLALTLERLEALCAREAGVSSGAAAASPSAPGPRRLRRIGLSATQRPMALVARFLVGNREEAPCAIIDEGFHRRRDLAIELPSSPLEPVMPTEVWEEVYDRIAALAREHRTTLVFANTRRLVERAARALAERLGEREVASHHGSLSRERRFEAEQRLKGGTLTLLVASASLELGIDIGDVDLVCQLGTTRNVATFLQRVGRSGHGVDATPKGRLFPLSRDDLVECAALFDAVRRGELDTLTLPEQPLDVLAQQIVAEVAAANEWETGALLALVRRAWPYRALDARAFESVVDMLAAGFTTRRGRRGAFLHQDRVNGRLRARRGARMTALTNAGTIPENADYAVVLEPSGTVIGSLNEDFAIETLPGDIFQLGLHSWRILRVESDRIRVEDAGGQPPTIPFWIGEAPARTDALSAAVSRLRETVGRLVANGNGYRNGSGKGSGKGNDRSSDCGGGSDAGKAAFASAGDRCSEGPPPTVGTRGAEARPPSPDEGGDPAAGEGGSGAGGGDTDGTGTSLAAGIERAVAWATGEAGLPAEAALQLVDYLAAGQAALGAMPTTKALVLERFFDDSGGMQLVIHSPLGGRINRAFGLALRKRFCRRFNFELQAAATEDNIVLSLGETHSFPLAEAPGYLASATARDVLVQAVLDAPLFNVRWRWNANVSLAVPRRAGGRKTPAPIQRMQAEDLVAVVFPDQIACAENLAGAREIPDHPLVRQTIHDALHEAMDADGLVALLEGIERGEVAVHARDLPEPSPFAHEVLNAKPYAFLDDAPLEERRTRAVSGRRWLDPASAADLGRLDPEAVERVRAEAWPDTDTADALHDALVMLGFLTEGEMRDALRLPSLPLAAGGTSAALLRRVGRNDGDDGFQIELRPEGGVGSAATSPGAADPPALVPPSGSGAPPPEERPRSEPKRAPGPKSGRKAETGYETAAGAGADTRDGTTPETGAGTEAGGAARTLATAAPSPELEADAARAEPLATLVRERRAGRLAGAQGDGASALWVAAERVLEMRAARPDGEIALAPPPGTGPPASPEEALRELVRGRLGGLGPVTAPALAADFGVDTGSVRAALAALESEGFVLRGDFTGAAAAPLPSPVPARLPPTPSDADGPPATPTASTASTASLSAPAASAASRRAPDGPPPAEPEWCERRLLARIHRYTLARLRREIDPVEPADYMRFLFAWHGLDDRREGPAGLLAVIEQLEGFEAPAAVWEDSIFPARLRAYDPSWLDTLCLTGRVVWLRRTGPTTAPRAGAPRAGATNATRIAFIDRRCLAAWRPAEADGNRNGNGSRSGSGDGSPDPETPGAMSSRARRIRELLRTGGAQFFDDLQLQSGLLATQVEDGLAELVAGGHVTADGYAGLRALVRRHRRTGPRRRMDPFGNAGRWCLVESRLPPDHAAPAAAPPLDRIVDVLLRRYGVVFRKVLEREAGLPPWRELVRALRRREDRGEVRGGRFVHRFSGEQFALPEAVGELRRIRRAPRSGRVLALSAADPLNLTGIVTAGERVSSSAAREVAYRDGEPDGGALPSAVSPRRRGLRAAAPRARWLGPAGR